MKKAIVTGASSGIGQAIAEALLKKGYYVYGLGRDFSRSAIADEEGFAKKLCDLRDRQALVALIKEINKNHDIELFVSCGGVGYYGLHEELNAEKIHDLVAVNLEAPMTITNLLLRDLKKNKGAIAFISSVTAGQSNPHGCAYGATKAGLSSFARSLFDEARKTGLRVITIEPDMTTTRLYRNADFEADEDQWASLRPEEVAGALCYALKAREGMVISDIRLKPQLHRIKKKGNSAEVQKKIPEKDNK